MDMKGKLMARQWQKPLRGSKTLVTAPPTPTKLGGEGLIHSCLWSALAVSIREKGQISMSKTIERAVFCFRTWTVFKTLAGRCFLKFMKW